MGWDMGSQRVGAAGGSKGAYHHAWAVDRTPCGATLAAIVVSLVPLVGIGLGSDACMCYRGGIRVPPETAMSQVPAGGVESVIVVQPLSLGFRAASWPRAPMSCDLGCVDKWVGDSDCGGVVGGPKCGRRRLAACTGAPRSKCDGKRKWQVAGTGNIR